MIVTPASSVAGHRVVKTLGLVRGNTIRARHLGKDVLAIFKNVLGGEIEEYTKMMAEAREQALDREDPQPLREEELDPDRVVGPRGVVGPVGAVVVLAGLDLDRLEHHPRLTVLALVQEREHQVALVQVPAGLLG